MKAALEPQFKRTIVGRTKHSGSTAACLYKILNIHNIYTPKAGKEYIGFLVWFGLIYAFVLVLVLSAVASPFQVLSHLFSLCTQSCLRLNEILLRQLLSTTSPPLPFYLIVCEMQLDLVSAGKI